MLLLLTSIVSGLRLPSGPTERPVSYSNPLGRTLTEIRKGVWLAERPFYPRLPGLTGVDVACKAAVVRLQDGSLWVHSPVFLDDDTKKQVDALGDVRFIVSPNAEHVSFAQAWIDAYGEATSYAPPYLRQRFPIAWDHEITTPPPEWNDEFEMLWIDAEKAPLVGSEPFFSELVFCHKPSKILFVTDLWWNYPQEAPKLWKFAMDRVYRPVYNNLMRQRPRHDDYVRTIVNKWDFDYVAPCHGEPIGGPDVKPTLLRFFDLDEV
ncbi:hypothetical protein CTAYLR_003180 [Chrysophaeum taylorii]|uniref:DUF4336 domain-containing protein n=1 Tax=Chrysophaeum taylorii TaxID=2483200 RepID=A0AAD7UCC0_9STRA|nr:hypothetical protein CTAYLR_003180 [Chrysophaeum taylorii]